MNRREISIIITVLYCLLFAVTPAFAQQVSSIKLSLDEQLLKNSNINAEMQANVQKTCQIGIYKNESNAGVKANNVLVSFAPEGRNLMGMAMYAYFVNQLSFLQIAPQPEITNTNSDYISMYFYTLQAIEYAKNKGLVNRRAKTILIGHSGGAKLALMIGAMGGTTYFNGVLAMGCNQDYATEGYRLLSNQTALNLPIVLLNATDDNLVIGKTEKVLDSMYDTGFHNIYLQSHTGGHRIPFKEGLECLSFLLKQ